MDHTDDSVVEFVPSKAAHCLKYDDHKATIGKMVLPEFFAVSDVAKAIALFYVQFSNTICIRRAYSYCGIKVLTHHILPYRNLHTLSQVTVY